MENCNEEDPNRGESSVSQLKIKIMTKEELQEKLKIAEEATTQEERVKILEDIREALKKANQELKDLYKEAMSK